MTLTDLAHHLGEGLSRQNLKDQGTFQNDPLSFLGLAHDSRHVKAGDVFVVIPCDQAEAHTRAAIQAGAVALVAESDFVEVMRSKLRVPMISVACARLALSKAAALLYPGQPETIVAVTGTNGKSSVVTFVRQIWQHLGLSAASLGTLGVEISPHVHLKSGLAKTKLTTPDALAFHQILNTLAASGITHCAFEASSHGLAQYRPHGVKLKAAGFTNLSQDHLDYHETMDTYFEAKVKLFTDVLPVDKTAVINVASPYFSSLKAVVSGHGQTLLTYSVNQPADLMAQNVRPLFDKITFDLTIQGQTWRDVSLNMVGAFQVENVLCAIGLILAGGEVSASDIVGTLPYLRSAPGRMELVGKTPQGSAVFIDYSHKPEALGCALRALRRHVSKDGRLRVVFGCGGNRDAQKRAQMGEIAQTLADEVYITDDNPRDEDPAFIRAQILVSCPKAHEIGDRRQAIKTAIGQLGPGDILLIAGKGHEQGQIIGDRIIPFDDRTEAQIILKAGTI